MTKYREYYKRMYEANKELFDNFKKLHEEYSLSPERLQARFNEEGEKVLTVVRDWENRLCSQSEKGGFGVYTPKLAEKFQEEVRAHFPLIDHVGIKVSSPPLPKEAPFVLKKINLS